LRILLLTHRIPFPQNGGYPIVVCNTIKGLLALGHQVSLIAMSNRKNHHDNTDEDLELLGKIHYTVFRIDTSVSILEVAVNLFSKSSFNINKYYDPDFEKLLVKELRETTYDIIQFEGLYVAIPGGHPQTVKG